MAAASALCVAIRMVAPKRSAASRSKASTRSPLAVSRLPVTRLPLWAERAAIELHGHPLRQVRHAGDDGSRRSAGVHVLLRQRFQLARKRVVRGGHVLARA